MRWYLSFLIIPIIFLVACGNNGPAPRPGWAGDANQQIMGGGGSSGISSGISQSTSSVASALIAVTDIQCGTSEKDAYLVNVTWVTSLDEPDLIEIEYQISEVGGTVVIDDSIEGEYLNDPPPAGSLAFPISKDEIDVIGDTVLVRMKVEMGPAIITSPTNVYEIERLCTGI